MEENGLHRHLLETTEEEFFYRQYHEAKRSPEQLAAFLSSSDAGYLSRHKFVLPEMKQSLDLHFDNENWFWEDPQNDIFIHKHPRYMPEWDFVHEYYELVFAYDGSFDLHVSGQVVQMRPGFVCIIPPGVHHHISIFDDSIALNTKVRKSTFHSSFSPFLTGDDMLARFFLNTIYIGDHKDFILFRSEGDQRLKALFSEVYLEHFNREKYYPGIMNSLLSIIFSHLMRRYEDAVETAAVSQNRLKKLEAMLSYIESNYRNVSLGQLAKEFYFSEQYLSKYIKDNTGKTFKEIVQSKRLENAKKLLETSNLTVGKISEASGYPSAEHFMRQFKERFGVSPAAYRKEATGQSQP